VEFGAISCSSSNRRAVLLLVPEQQEPEGQLLPASLDSNW
jgi:hypothetical protein